VKSLGKAIAAKSSLMSLRIRFVSARGVLRGSTSVVWMSAIFLQQHPSFALSGGDPEYVDVVNLDVIHPVTSRLRELVGREMDSRGRGQIRTMRVTSSSDAVTAAFNLCPSFRMYMTTPHAPDGSGSVLQQSRMFERSNY
jgi:hypothetical protein